MSTTPETGQSAVVIEGPLTGRIYAVTKWHLDETGALTIADEKYDITDSLSIYLAARGIHLPRAAEGGGDRE